FCQSDHADGIPAGADLQKSSVTPSRAGRNTTLIATVVVSEPVRVPPAIELVRSSGEKIGAFELVSNESPRFSYRYQPSGAEPQEIVRVEAVVIDDSGTVAPRQLL